MEILANRGLGISLLGTVAPNNTMVELGGSFHLSCMPHDFWMTSGNYWYILFTLTSVVCRLYAGPEGVSNCTAPHDVARFHSYRKNYVLSLDVNETKASDTGLYICAQPPVYSTMGELGLIGVVGVVVKGPSVTSFRGRGGSFYLRCYVEFLNVVRTNAHVTWYNAADEEMPLVASTAMTATVKSPGCQSRRRRRWRRRTGGGGGRGRRASGEYTCRVRWDRSRPFIPERVYRDFLTLATSKFRPALELCVTTDPCAKNVQKVLCDILPSGDDKPIDETDVDGTGKVGSGSGGSLPSPSFTHASIVVFVAISTILFRFVRCASWH